MRNQPLMTTIRVGSADTSLTDLEESIAGMNGGDQVRKPLTPVTGCLQGHTVSQFKSSLFLTYKLVKLSLML